MPTRLLEVTVIGMTYAADLAEMNTLACKRLNAAQAQDPDMPFFAETGVDAALAKQDRRRCASAISFPSC